MTAPVRAYRLTLDLQADTRDDLTRALLSLAGRIDRDQVSTGVWGSPTDGAVYELRVDPEMTHDAYHQKLREHLAAGVQDVEASGGVAAIDAVMYDASVTLCRPGN